MSDGIDRTAVHVGEPRGSVSATQASLPYPPVILIVTVTSPPPAGTELGLMLRDGAWDAGVLGACCTVHPGSAAHVDR